MAAIADLDGQEFDSMTLAVETEETRNVEQSSFEVRLKTEKGAISSPVLKGLFSRGWENAGIKPWADMEFSDSAELPGEKAVVLSRLELDTKLFEMVGKTLPQGGSLMVAYQMFRKRETVHKVTDRMLRAELPASTTPIGVLLVYAGCYSFRDWYIPEGGREGPQKLQGWKPLKGEEKKKREALLKELKSFLRSKEKGRDYEATARKNAEKLVETLES